MKNTGIVEAVLLLEVEPVELAVLARICGIKPQEAEQALAQIIQRYSAEDFGIIPVKIAGGWTFSPKEHLWNSLKGRYGRQNEAKLSRAALETLSIIAYSQPLTKAEVENLRGVGAEGMLRMLKDKGLIKEVGRKDTPGRPVLYGTTREFLKIFSLESIAELPKLNELDEEKFSLNDTEKK